jgi:cytochrome c
MGRQPRQQVAFALFAALAVLIGGEAIPLSSRAAEQLDGKALFERRCGGCHALDRDKEGPRLGGVYGRTAGAIDSFHYSDALKNARIVWTEGTLARWLTDTEKLVPNNDMSFQVRSADERSAIIAYLKTSPGK